jgi:anti-anti-sigma regulatory factor
VFVNGQKLAIALPTIMARIRTAHRADCTVVTVTGRLTAIDMGRLEHACSPALITPAVHLEIDLRGVTHTDPTAAAVLQRMTKRGAVLTTSASG